MATMRSRSVKVRWIGYSSEFNASLRCRWQCTRSWRGNAGDDLWVGQLSALNGVLSAKADQILNSTT